MGPKDKTETTSPDVAPIVTPVASGPSEIDLLRAEMAALKAKMATPASEQMGKPVCNACGVDVKEGDRCKTHPRETVNVCFPDGTFRAY